MAVATSTIATAALVASLAATAASTGITMYGQQQQADQQARMAEYNANLQMQNIAVQQKMADYQRQVNEANAQQLENYAAAQQAQGLEQAARTRQEKVRALAVARGKYAASGVAEEGSPLAVLADTATNYELVAQDQLWKANNDATDSQWKAKQIRTGSQAQFDLSGIQAQLDTQRNNLELQSGLNTAAGTRLASYGTLFSGISQFGSSYANYYAPGRSVNASVTKG